MESFLNLSSVCCYTEVMLHLQKLGRIYPSLLLCDFGYLGIASGFPITQLCGAEHQLWQIIALCILQSSDIVKVLQSPYSQSHTQEFLSVIPFLSQSFSTSYVSERQT